MSRPWQPEYVRGALFSSHAHYWEYMTGIAYTSWHIGHWGTRVHGATVWRKRRRVVKP